MAKSLNQVTLVGRLGKDPEIRRTANGGTVASFTMATDDGYKGKDGEWQNQTDWHNVTVFGKSAEIVQQYCTKGMLVVVDGMLKTESWEDREGNKRYRTYVKARNVIFGGKGDGNSKADAGAGQEPAGQSPFNGDDMPF